MKLEAGAYGAVLAELIEKHRAENDNTWIRMLRENLNDIREARHAGIEDEGILKALMKKEGDDTSVTEEMVADFTNAVRDVMRKANDGKNNSKQSHKPKGGKAASVVKTVAVSSPSSDESNPGASQAAA